MNRFVNNQNDDYLLKLIKASTVAYTKAKYWEIRFTYFILFLAAAYPVLYIFIQDEQVKLILFICSLFLTFSTQVLTDIIKGNTVKGVACKEAFDVQLFGLPWKSTIKKPDMAEVDSLSAAFKGKNPKNWYSVHLSDKLSKELTIAACQRINTGWDIDLRRKYKTLLQGFLIVYFMAVMITCFWLNIPGKTIFLLFFSTASVYTFFITQIRGHNAVIRKRKAISKMLDEFLFEHKLISSLQVLRDIQDEIYITRLEAAKVPNFFFRWHHKKMNRQYDSFVAAINSANVTNQL